ncbi:putative MFS family arabinose efflux permease [Nonomuraea fuscirosea]|uniref:Putative MFS family arabinose efflux permease n=1 Tax=Nonomuraea fuscirosea TaxID=1291556 RepID=A0A2T0MQF1_9ACTN|nr:MFS transporter [Nonomuraea fuscirosea]PRX60345.1 putative MFS family arabinose efflux permease [Nonomuraea fuscirosea]
MANLLGERRFRRLFTAATTSGLGDGLRITAFAVFAATLTRDPFQVTLVAVAAHLPWVLVGPFIGALVDHLDHTRALRACYLVQAVVMTAFVALILTHRASIPVLIVVAFVMTSVETMAYNLIQAATPELSGSADLNAANSWLQGGQFIATEFLGAPLGAALFVVGWQLPFLIDAMTFGVAAILLLGLKGKGPPTPRVDFRSLFRETADGCAWLFRHRLLRTVCLLVGIANLTTVGAISISVLYALEILHISRTGYGLLMLIIAVGGLLGLIAVRKIAALLGNERTLGAALAVLPLAFLAGSLTSEPIVAALAFALVGAGISAGRVVTTTMRQIMVPQHMFGKVTGAFALFISGTAPIGALLAGVIADRYGLRAPFFAGTFVLALTALAAFRELFRAAKDQ